MASVLQEIQLNVISNHVRNVRWRS